MDKNLIPKIAKMLGVEIGEEFLLRDVATGFICSKEIFIFMVEDRCKEFNGEVRFKKKSDNGHQYSSSAYSTEIFQQLCEGRYEIVKIPPWKPKIGDYYWTFDKSNASTCIRWTVGCFFWENSPFDICAFKNGWVFRTEDEAEEALPVVAKEMGVYY